MRVLRNWNMFTENGYLYLTGDLYGRDWVTSNVTSMYETDTHYVVHTSNSVYHLYY